jgi:hypothetical protein
MKAEINRYHQKNITLRRVQNIPILNRNIFILIKFQNLFYSNEQTIPEYEKRSKEFRKIFRINGIKSLHILDNNISNMRRPGYSEFQSSNTLQNSSHIYSFPKSIRMDNKLNKKLCDNIYNIPEQKSTRFTTLGYGKRGNASSELSKYPSPQEYEYESLFDYNIKHKKGITILGKPSDPMSKENFPGAGSYKVKNLDKLGNIPIVLKFRHGFYYDDEMKKKKATVSMQKYSPKFNYVKINRYKGAGIGFGKRGSASKEETPGPANYDVPRIFDRGVKKDLVIN